MKTIKNFIEYCGESVGALVCPVKNQTGLEVADFWDELENVSNSPCGAAGGFCGFVYYSQTCTFWRKNRKAITNCMKALADSLGENLLGLVCGFNGLKDYEQDEIGRALYGNYNEDLMQIYNVFAWFALEEVAHRYSDWVYENEF